MISQSFQSTTPKKFKVRVDRNNFRLFDKFGYWLSNNTPIYEDQSEFHLENMRLEKEKFIPILLPKKSIKCKWESEDLIIIHHSGHRQSVTTKMFPEFRFDYFTVTSHTSIAHLQSFIVMLETLEIPESAENDLKKFIYLPQDSCWKYCGIFKRSLETIYFRKKKEIVKSLDYFLNSVELQALYTKLHIPYKKIFLFHGPPGSGKTSFIQALATEFKYNISVIKNIMEMDDGALENMISRMVLRKRTFLVFEDIDCLFNNRQMTVKTKVSFSGILNMLDGIGTYDKLVIFITTNHQEKFDPAFKRRIDSFVEFGTAHSSEICEMFGKFFDKDGTKFAEMIKNKKITINSLEKYFVHCLQNGIEPPENLTFLNEYHSTTSVVNNHERLYN